MNWYKIAIEKGKINPNIPSWVEEGILEKGGDPNRLLNEIDIARPETQEALHNDPLLPFLLKNYPEVANKLLKGQMTKKEYLYFYQAERQSKGKI